MRAIETVRKIMNSTGTTLADLEDYTELGTASNICQMLTRNDLKVGTFVEILETMGFQLVAQSEETGEEYVIDNEGEEY